MVKEQLLAFMKGHFGSNAEGLLNAQAANTGIKDLERMTPEQKINLAENIMKNCFSSVMSSMKLRMINGQLYSIIGIVHQQETGMI
jgi:hypothetical protein